MGKVATSYADFVVVTSDNPRKEEPEKIINDIVSGFVPDPNYTSITDRKEAIIYALQTATSDDAVLIAGKGHERFQYINEAKLEFDDVQITTQELQRMAHG